MIEIPVWSLLAIALLFAVSAVAIAAFSYRVGLIKARQESNRRIHNLLRELEAREQIRIDSHKARTVTESGMVNPGRSRVRKAIKGR